MRANAAIQTAALAKANGLAGHRAYTSRANTCAPCARARWLSFARAAGRTEQEVAQRGKLAQWSWLSGCMHGAQSESVPPFFGHRRARSAARPQSLENQNRRAEPARSSAPRISIVDRLHVVRVHAQDVDLEEIIHSPRDKPFACNLIIQPSWSRSWEISLCL